MSILIKGASSLNEGLYQIQDGKIHAYKGNGGKVQEFDLVEVPTPHGRLIDGDDAFIDADERGFDFWSCDADIDSAHEFLMAQPTFIEAEEGEA